jgi:hypothetical protein
MSISHHFSPAVWLMIASAVLAGCASHDVSSWDNPSGATYRQLNPGERHLQEQLPRSGEPLMWEDYYTDPPAPGTHDAAPASGPR